MESVTTVEKALQKIGFGSVQIQLICIGCLVLLVALNDTLGTSFFLPAAQCDLQLTTADKGFLSGMTFLGVTISSYFWGFLGDTQGRRWVILNALLFSSFFAILSSFMKLFPLFVMCRFMVGIFVSGYSTTLYAYIGEFNTNQNRTTIISLMTISIGIANVFIPMSAMTILSFDWTFELYHGYLFRPWRLLILVYTMPGIIASIWLLKMPESPRFLLAINEHNKALKVVKWIEKINNEKSVMQITSLESEIRSENKVINQKDKCTIFHALLQQTLPLLKPPYLIYVAACSFMHFGTFAISNGLGVFIPDILNKLLSSEEDMKVCDALEMDTKVVQQENSTILLCNDTIDTKVFYNTAIMGSIYTLGFILIVVSVKFLSHKRVLNFTLLISSVAGFLLLQFVDSIYITAGYIMLVVFAGINISIINSIICDAIPTNLRSMAVCVAMLFGRLGSVAAANLFGQFSETYCSFTHYGFASLLTICFVISFMLPK